MNSMFKFWSMHRCEPLIEMEDSVILFTLTPLVGESVLIVGSEFIVDVLWHPKRLQFWTSEACSPEIGPLQHMLQATDSPQVPSADPEKTITGVYPIKPPGCVVRNVSPNEVSIPTTPGFEPQAQSPLEEIEEEDSVNSPAETKRSRRKNGGKRRKRTHNQTQVQYRSKSSLVPLFSKELTVSDADMRNGRLVLPKRCAEVYFPNISGQQGIFLMVQDTKGNDWELYFHYWSNSNGKMYLLEGLKDYMVLMKWEVGDTGRPYARIRLHIGLSYDTNDTNDMGISGFSVDGIMKDYIILFPDVFVDFIFGLETVVYHPKISHFLFQRSTDA
ncbi:B3 domain-containing protein [Hibiscus syriacus]|uniref:B3 domain-containing protein n=1 Tax=Hibiscus syriacus TaxID=106335 RepID=A0A6A3CRV5_HIBSY|nr:B3 domain-containing protein [Hibiscus syriacus]